MDRQAVRGFIYTAKGPKETILGEALLQGLAKHEDALKSVEAAAKIKSDWAMQLDMEEELAPLQRADGLRVVCQRGRAGL